MQTRSFLAVATFGLIAASGAVQAHHSLVAEYDPDKPVKFEGTVARVEWISPHTWFHIDVKKADGTTERWMIEGGTPGTLFRRGVTQKSLPVGTVIRVDGLEARDGSLKAYGRNMTLPNGQMLFVGSSGPGEAPPGKK